MPMARLDQAYTFLATFLDHMDQPLTVSTPLIDVFYFDSNGDKQALVSDAAMTSLGSGQYTYAYTPTGLGIGTLMVGWMRGTSDGLVQAEEQVYIRDSNPLVLSR